MRELRIAVLLSGSGTTLENLFAHQEAGTLSGKIVFVVGSRPDAYGLERARKRGLPTAVIERKKYLMPEEFSEALFTALRAHQPDLICLAGFLSAASTAWTPNRRTGPSSAGGRWRWVDCGFIATSMDGVEITT